MEGVLDWMLRDQLGEVGGVDRMVTEFVRVTDRIVPDHVFRRYCPELNQNGRTRSGVPVFVQLLGGQPGPMAESAARVSELGAPGVDLNFGCPARTVNRHDGGAVLLKTPDRLFQIVRAVRAAVPRSRPVTAKVRLGFDHKDFHREIAHAVDEGGAAHMVVHARTKAEMYTPPAHWRYIRHMAEGIKVPILANGDIWSSEDYYRCREITGLGRVALGRGLVRRPTLALEIRGHRQTPFSRSDFITRFFETALGARGEPFAVARLKQVLRYWADDTDTRLRTWFDRAKTLKSAGAAIELLREFRKEETWLRSPSTPGPIAPTAYGLKTS